MGDKNNNNNDKNMDANHNGRQNKGLTTVLSSSSTEGTSENENGSSIEYTSGESTNETSSNEEYTSGGSTQSSSRSILELIMEEDEECEEETDESEANSEWGADSIVENLTHLSRDIAVDSISRKIFDEQQIDHL